MQTTMPRMLLIRTDIKSLINHYNYTVAKQRDGLLKQSAPSKMPARLVQSGPLGHTVCALRAAQGICMYLVTSTRPALLVLARSDANQAL
jgi:hypothetical protein